MQVDWQWHTEVSVIHAAWCVNTFPHRTGHCPADLRQACLGWVRFVDAMDVPAAHFWETLFCLTSGLDGPRALVERLFKRLGRHASDQLANDLRTQLITTQDALQLAFPKMNEQLPLRAAPLQGQWEAHGPGLLLWIGRTTDANLMVDAAAVELVQPILGGSGYAHLDTNRVHLEAVLTNEIPELPETLRLAWLLSQLNCDLPRYSELFNRHELRKIAGLAMIPPTLKAGEELGITRYAPDTVQGALQNWHSDVLPDGDWQAVAEALDAWWETFESSRPEWRIALAGLQQMLQ